MAGAHSLRAVGLKIEPVGLRLAGVPSAQGCLVDLGPDVPRASGA
ncbi:hypothetical protein [Streptomyces sp. SID8375]|nr:hypothetical protein [Streptomyces sp. SID8375]